MTVQQQKRYLKNRQLDLRRAFSRFRIPNALYPDTAAVTAARERHEKARAVINKHEKACANKWDKVCARAKKRLQALERTILFGEPADALKETEKFEKDFAKYLGAIAND